MSVVIFDRYVYFGWNRELVASLCHVRLSAMIVGIFMGTIHYFAV